MPTKKTLWKGVRVLGILVSGLLLLWCACMPKLDEEGMRRVLDDVSTTRPSGVPSVLRIRWEALRHRADDAFGIPIDRDSELLAFKSSRYSNLFGEYDVWCLYPEPLYRTDYLETAKAEGIALAPTNYCRYFLSEYIRNRGYSTSNLVKRWPESAWLLPDGMYCMAIGTSAIAGHGVCVYVDGDGKLLKYVRLFSEM